MFVEHKWFLTPFRGRLGAGGNGVRNHLLGAEGFGAGDDVEEFGGDLALSGGAVLLGEDCDGVLDV